MSLMDVLACTPLLLTILTIGYYCPKEDIPCQGQLKNTGK